MTFTYQEAAVKRHRWEGGRISIYWSDWHDVQSVDATTCRCRSAEFL